MAEVRKAIETATDMMGRPSDLRENRRMTLIPSPALAGAEQ